LYQIDTKIYYPKLTVKNVLYLYRPCRYGFNNETVMKQYKMRRRSQMIWVY